MNRVVLREHGRLWPEKAGRPAAQEGAQIHARAYERLRRFDGRLARRDGSVFTWYAGYAKAAQWVGVVQVDDVQIEILPKVDARDEQDRLALLSMLAIAGDVPIRSRELASLATRRASLADALARLFAERLLSELLRGPERAYVRRRDNLHRFKGKLVVKQQILRNSAHGERFLCDFEELISDTPLNQLFRAACQRLLASTRQPRTTDALRHCLLLLDEVSDIVVTREHLDRVVMTRQNARFEALYDFCRMLFSGHGPTAQAGPTHTFSLLFDMNVVFERFITAFVRRYVLASMPGWQLFPQGQSRRRHLLRSAGRGLLRLEPDLLFERPDGSLMIVDTKWKRLVPGREQASLSRADLYQLYAYSKRFGAERSVLLFPSVDGCREHVLDVLNDGDEPTEGRIEVRYVDLRKSFHAREGRGALVEELRGMLVRENPSMTRGEP